MISLQTTPATDPIAEPIPIGTRRTRIKICGITNKADALLAAALGADAVGLVLTDSPRQVTADQAADIVRALPPFVMAVGVFRNQSPADINRILRTTGIHAAQLHGDESPQECTAVERPVIKRFDLRTSDDAIRIQSCIEAYNVAAHLFDPGAGDGCTFDWTLARHLSRRLILAGGLTQQNVAEAITVTAPFAVDVCTGVERKPGIKDREKLSAFIQEVRHHDADTNRS